MKKQHNIAALSMAGVLALCSTTPAAMATELSPSPTAESSAPTEQTAPQFPQQAPKIETLDSNLQGNIEVHQVREGQQRITVSLPENTTETEAAVWLIEAKQFLGPFTVPADSKIEVQMPSGLSSGSDTLAVYGASGSLLGWSGINAESDSPVDEASPSASAEPTEAATPTNTASPTVEPSSKAKATGPTAPPIPSSSASGSATKSKTAAKKTVKLSKAASTAPVYVSKAAYLVDKKGGTKKIRRVPAGSQLIVSSNSGGWVKAKYGATTGWIKTSLTVKSLKPKDNKKYTSFIKQDAPLRRFPNAAAPRLRTEQGGTQVTVTHTQGEWVKIADGTKTGWVNAKNDLTSKRPYRKTSGVWFAKNDIPLRPTSNYSTALLKIPGGSKVQIKSYAKDWCQVTYKGKTGFVMAENKDLAKKVTVTDVKDYKRYVHHTSKIRKTPTTSPYDPSFEPVGQNEPVTVLAKVPGKRGWVQVKHGAYVGYMLEASDLVSKPRKVAPVKTEYRKKYSGLEYALIDGGVNWSKPIGKVMFMDGDYYTRGFADSTSEWPQGNIAKSMAAVAAKRNMVLVIPRIPTHSKELGYTWWENSKKNAVKIKALDAYLDSRLGTSQNSTWYMGYSGGAEFITYELASRGQSGYGRAGAILLAGGGSEDIEYRSAPATFKAAFDMHWFVGSKDGVGQSSNAPEWSAFKASAEGEKFFRSQGFKTSRTILNGLDHHDYNLAKVLDQGLKKAGL